MKFTAENLSTNIQAYRKKAGMTQKQLAALLNVSFQTVSKWENGKSRPDVLLFPALAEIFSCSVDELFSYQLRHRVFYNIPNEFVLLWRTVEKQWLAIEKDRAGNQDMQVIAMLTPNDRSLLMFVNHTNSKEDENEMLYDMGREKVQVDRILCMWSGGEIDLPSYHFRKGLLEIHPKNKDAQILLMNTNGFLPRSLESTM